MSEKLQSQDNQRMGGPELALARELLAVPSITPNDAGVQSILINRLSALGFSITKVQFQGRDNFYAEWGTSGPRVVFSGHTDVVEPGDEAAWRCPPFEPTVIEGKLYGRGAVDMKGAIACMVVATEEFFERVKGAAAIRVGFLIAGDEEHDFNYGTEKLLEELSERGIKLDHCIVGEPASQLRIGDEIKVGRRGSLTGKLKLLGTQGHAAHPHKADNPIHHAAPILNALLAEEWDCGNEYFIPSSFQITNIKAGTGSANVIPGVCELTFNLRYSSELTEAEIQRRVHSVLDGARCEYELEWIHGAKPFLTAPGKLRAVVETVLERLLGKRPVPSTSGGTSDARYIAARGIEVIELGLLNETIHRVDEHTEVVHLRELTNLYREILLEFNRLQ